MIVAVASDGVNVSNHFGHCKYFALFTIEEDAVSHLELMKNPEVHVHGQLPTLLKEHGVEVIITGTIGEHASSLIKQKNMRLYKGFQGAVQDAIDAWIDGALQDEEVSCNHDQHQSECNH
ncbi:MAG: NifB/NifX family molybdenum-iron cluster-binding protein [Candidatus Izemoplasmatales bacterium]|nr:NifB/NifX family molybdenum-iron cluster-binding protein [bacterium]MDZ4195673.1 NifB/NifX family molybdenum-iron cluster-binding protein [Candidatus Izemoplasmatales bacterium]